MIAISNVGKYQTSHEPTGDVGIKIITQNPIGLIIDKVAYNNVDTIVCAEGISNTILVSKDNGVSFQTQTLPYDVNRIYYCNSLNKFYLFEASNTSSLHFAVSSNALDWQWVEFFSITDSNILVMLPSNTKNETENGFAVNVFCIYKHSDGQTDYIAHYEVNISNETFTEKNLVSNININTFITNATQFVSYSLCSNYVEESYAIGISYKKSGSSSTNYEAIVMGNWGVSILSTSSYNSTYPTIKIKSNKYISTTTSSSYTTLNYSYNGRAQASINFKNRSIVSFVGIGNMYYAYTQNTIVGCDTLQTLADCAETVYGNLGDLTLICNAMPLTDKLIMFTSEMGTIYVCEIK